MHKLTPDNPINISKLKEIAAERFGDMVKGVVDLDRNILLIDADLHADQEAELLSSGSKQNNLWGINLYPDLSGSDFIEFDSMINLRPSQNNLSRSVEDPQLQEKILALVKKCLLP